MKTYKLLLPGPVDIADDIREAMASPQMPHYGEDWLAIYHETVALLRQVFQTQNDLYLMTGPGTAGLDAALGSLLDTGEKVLVPYNGFFGQRLATVARCYGLQAVPLEFPAHQPVDPDAVRARLDAEGDVRAVVMVHHETSTGVLNPVQEVACLSAERAVPIIVDAIASIGGIPLPVDEWGLDVVVATANKCLESTPGLVMVSVSPRAWQMVDDRPGRAHGWYLNLETWREYAEAWADWHPYPTTLPTQNVLALRTALRRILAKGLDEHYAEHVRAAERVRSGLCQMGFELFVRGEAACPLVTAVKARPGLKVEDLIQFLREQHGIMISGGVGKLRGKIFRVGHMGRAISDEYMDAFLTAVADFLQL
jgi:aspartate aminotransferase-like enzyme